MAETKSSLVEERRVVKAAPEVVFTVLTSPADMVGWLCDEARCETRPGASYELGWNTGYTVHGKVMAVERSKLFTVAWHGSGEPGETTVSFALTPKDNGTEVTIRHSGFGRGAKWAAAIAESRKGWVRGLECLAYLVETGVDLRDARRPMMGVSLGEQVDADRLAKEGVDATTGVYLAGVSEGMSAQAAGLRAHDVVTTIDGKPIPDFPALVSLLRGHVAGDLIEVAYVRGKEHKTCTLELKPKPMPDIPFDSTALLAALLERYEKARSGLVKVMAGVSEEKAGWAPAEGEWSAKEAIAHLCVTERDLHYLLGDLLLGNETHTPGNPSVLPEKLAAVLSAAPTVAGLLNRLAQDQADTLAIVAALRPEIIVNKARYHRIGQTVYDFADHVDEHIGQIRAALAAVK